MPELSTEFIEELTKKLRAIGSLKAVGDTWVSFDSSVPPGGVPFCGQTVSRALYADLLTWATEQGKVKTEEEWQTYAAANGGNCPYYSEGDSLTTFRMPCVLGYLRGSSVTTDGGKYKPQALPIPTLKNYIRQDVTSLSTNGATDKWGNDGATTGSNSSSNDEYMIDSSTLPNGNLFCISEIEENDIYKADCDKVTPETFHVLVGVYAVGVITNINNTDVSQLQTGLATLEANTVKTINNKAPTAGNINISAWGKPNDEYLDVSDTSIWPYTAPRSGVLYVREYSGSNAYAVEILVNGVTTGQFGSYNHVTIPFKKGDKLQINGTVNYRKIMFNKED